MRKHLPNALTLFRLLLIIPFLMFLWHHDYVGAFYIFILAGFTDGIDGWLARHFHWESFLGSLIDPLADKLLVAASFLSLALLGKLPSWLVILVFSRDLTISSGVLAWYWIVRRHLNFEPTLMSKMNTIVQLTLVTLCLFELAFYEFNPFITNVFILLTSITTATTYIDYVYTWGKKACSINRLAK